MYPLVQFPCSSPPFGADIFLATAEKVCLAGAFHNRTHCQPDIGGKPREPTTMTKSTYRVVTRGMDGSLRIKDYPSKDPLLQLHTQIGVDDCSTDLSLRGLPVFRGLIGPMPEGKNVIRYESPEVFETLTKEWTLAKPARKTRRRSRGARPNGSLGSSRSHHGSSS
jgi:hypothetical protein